MASVAINQPRPRRRVPWPLLWSAAPWATLALAAALWNRLPSRRLKAFTPAVSKTDHPPGMSLDLEASPASFEAAEPGRGREADAPYRIPAVGWRDVLWRTLREVNEDRLSIVAGGVTFYTLLAIFPAVGVFASLYGLFADIAEVRRQLADMALVMPTEALNIVGDQMMRLAVQGRATLSIAFVVSLLLSVWSARNGMGALFAGLNVAYDEAERRNYFVLTGLTYLFTLGALVFVTLVSGLLVAAPIMLERLHLIAGLLEPLRWLALWAVAGGAFSILYRYGPSRARARWRWVTWGGVFAATLWLGGSAIYSWYINNLAHLDVTYGPLGAVIGFMMWIWFSVMVLLLGAELNAEIEHQTALDSTTGAPEPMGRRGAAMADTVGVAHPDFRAMWSRTLKRARLRG